MQPSIYIFAFDLRLFIFKQISQNFPKMNTDEKNIEKLTMAAEMLAIAHQTHGYRPIFSRMAKNLLLLRFTSVWASNSQPLRTIWESLNPRGFKFAATERILFYFETCRIERDYRMYRKMYLRGISFSCRWYWKQKHQKLRFFWGYKRLLIMIKG